MEDWAKMEDPHGTIFVSIPSLLDASVAPDGCHVMHVFTPDWVDNWTVSGGQFCRLSSLRTAAVRQPLVAARTLPSISFECRELRMC